MSRRHGHTTAALIFICVGLFFAALPMDSLELCWGSDPDGSSGLLEFILTALPLAIGTFAFARIFALRNLRHRAVQKTAAATHP